ncbi:NBP2 [[Candida] subhashii]|uniref:NBP2 n=1 Tax=[Candida] subhashii TaxID=561895 RepID=A0A8J5QN35_9ASCO|nr:NBP2 [[Candida] subhashii]KAG7663375.1 NBP2 [[Candida] subhashii]
MSHQITSLFPPSTSIKDYAYPESNPLHIGQYPPIDPEISSTSSSSSSSEEYPLHRDINHHLNAEDDSYDDSYDDEEYHRDEINRKARALFDFIPENDNEIKLTEGQIIWISYRHGQGWLVAEDPETGENGLIPEEYVEIVDSMTNVKTGLNGLEEEEEDVPKPFLPEILQDHHNDQLEDQNGEDDEWVDTTDEEEEGMSPRIIAQANVNDQAIKQLSDKVDSITI